MPLPSRADLDATVTSATSDVRAAASELAAFLTQAGERPALVLGGAGMSTESGIPDYRGPSGSLRNHTPMQYRTFITDARARHRYWARSYLGWPTMRRAQPNAGHLALARLQAAESVATIITQNVDGLHAAARQQVSPAADRAAVAGDPGNPGIIERHHEIIELHGGLQHTICLNCGDVGSRRWLESALDAINPDFHAHIRRINPDGDAEIDEADLDDFVMVDCPVCGGGPLKPDVVFFGETVPRERVDRCFAALDEAAGLVVLGSSLQVMSGYRFVLQAAKTGTPVAIVNQGPTRGDQYAQLRIDAPLGEVLTRVADL